MLNCRINNGRPKNCKTFIAGLEEVYLFPYNNPSKNDIIVSGKKLISYPPTQIFKYELNGDFSFNQETTDTDAGKLVNQSLLLKFPSLEVNTELQKLLKKDYSVIVKTRQGKFLVLGLYNGGVFKNLNSTTGDSRRGFSGYQIQYDAKESKDAFFIDDLEDVGFIDVPVENYLQLEDSTEGLESFLFLEEGTDEKIIL